MLKTTAMRTMCDIMVFTPLNLAARRSLAALGFRAA
jgi:hypothetical protein